MKTLLRTLLVMWIALSAHGAAMTQWRLLLSADTVKPGDTVWAGLDMKIPPKWHTYWRNAGDSGIAASVKWTLPSGIKAGDIQWPLPEKFTEEAGDISLVTYIYQDEAVLLIPLEVPKDAPAGPIELQGKVSWQECEQLCVQGKTDVSAKLTVGTETKASADSALIEQWRKNIPLPKATPNAKAFWDSASPAGEERRVVIEVNGSDLKTDFFPYKTQGTDVGGRTDVTTVGNPPEKVQLRKTITKTEGDWPKNVSGVLVSGNGDAVEVTLPIEEAAPIAAVTGESASIWKMLFFAFIGGLILNFMPCVMPVISLKVLGFVNQAKETPQRVRKLGLVYGLGVLVSFLVLALIAIGVQRAGGIADWGTAFRNPIFRVVITILITLVALNLFGLFEINLSGRAMGTAGDLSSKQGYAGAFFNGMLATILATPCTAPFLAPALAFAFTQTPLIVILFFQVVAIGLALPFVIVCLDPRLLKFLPKPGAWMHHFKVAMGFPMLATAMWLFWLTGTRMGKSGILWFGLFLVLLAFATWIWGQFVQRSFKRRGFAMLTAVLMPVVGYVYILEGKLSWRSPTVAVRETVDWKTWSPDAVDKARRDGHPVLVDFTADSCLNCQLNKLTSIEVAPTEQKLKEIGAVTFIADYTDENPVIAKELQRYNRPGVPLVLVFPADVNKPAIVLPPVLTKSVVLKALEDASATNKIAQSASAK